ncbi:MAG: rhodanese-like domain-containing protein, partial [Flavitalea sp.]
IVTLEDDVIVYPAHGAGSSCGKNIGPETVSTIGEQKLTNYALQSQSKEDFIKAVSSGLTTPPTYFPINAKINKEGYESLDGILETALTPLSVDAFEEWMNNDETVILDSRKSDKFTQRYIPGSISIGLEGRFAEWAGAVLPFDKPMVIVAEPGMEKETAIRLARVGFSRMMGYLDGGFDAWLNAGKEIDLIIDVEADELAMDIPFDNNLVVVDVRREAEFADEHVVGAVNIPLSDMADPGSMSNIEETQNVYVHCAGGYRSVIAISLLKRQGIHNVRNIVGGWGAIKNEKRIETVQDKSVLN